ncbi:DUF4312 family protein [Enemella sp. A6]|uniref:DUF4312 family protein n=1 Tax=Enemella sp. A6 TaxID=3440152 RepID=UPI003EBA78D7
MMLIEERKISVSGRGDSTPRAFQDALTSMRKKVMNERAEVILQIQPSDCHIKKAVKEVRTERFFGVLFPRERVTYSLDLEFTVEVRSVSLDDINYRTQYESLSLAQHALKLR